LDTLIFKRINYSTKIYQLSKRIESQQQDNHRNHFKKAAGRLFYI